MKMFESPLKFHLSLFLGVHIDGLVQKRRNSIANVQKRANDPAITTHIEAVAHTLGFLVGY